MEREAGQRAVRGREEALAAARAARANWLTVERPAAEARDALEADGDAQALENTRSELDQLVRMYEEDELVDETEAIVLARARFDLARRIAINDLNARQREYRAEVERPKRDQAFERSVRDREEDLEGVRRDFELDRAGRGIARDRAQRELEKKARRAAEIETDLAALAVKAPAAGVLLHGPLEGGAARRDRLGRS